MLAIWVVFAVLAAGGAMLIVRPLLVRPKDIAGTAAVETEATLNIYRDQFAEIERELERGLIGATEAEAARTEVARRLLGHAASRAQSGDGVQAEAARAPSKFNQNIALCVLFGVPIVALLIYLPLGMPTMSSRPHAERAAVRPESAGIKELIARVEARLIERPDDGEGWDVIAPIYLRLGRYTDAVNAFANAIRLNGENLARLSGLAEAAVSDSPGGVPDVARRAFERILVLSPGRFDARFWLAVAKEQDGKGEAAKADYESILKASPADAPWRKLVNERLAALEGTTPAPSTSPPVGSPAEVKQEAPRNRGPGQDEIEAASRMTPDERQAMVRAMVDGLDKRLESNGSDAEGWRRLMQAFIVLGEKDKAMVALSRARKALFNDALGLASVEAAARQLKLTQ